jgi:hypothetical protein
MSWPVAVQRRGERVPVFEPGLLVVLCGFWAAGLTLGGGGVVLHVDMFAHNKSGIAYQDRNQRPATVVNNMRAPHQQQHPTTCYQVPLVEHLLSTAVSCMAVLHTVHRTVCGGVSTLAHVSRCGSLLWGWWGGVLPVLSNLSPPSIVLATPDDAASCPGASTWPSRCIRCGSCRGPRLCPCLMQ